MPRSDSCDAGLGLPRSRVGRSGGGWRCGATGARHSGSLRTRRWPLPVAFGQRTAVCAPSRPTPALSAHDSVSPRSRFTRAISSGSSSAGAAPACSSASAGESHQIGPPSPEAHEMQPVDCDGRIREPSVAFRFRIGTRHSITVPWAVSRVWIACSEQHVSYPACEMVPVASGGYGCVWGGGFSARRPQMTDASYGVYSCGGKRPHTGTPPTHRHTAHTQAHRPHEGTRPTRRHTDRETDKETDTDSTTHARARRSCPVHCRCPTSSLSAPRPRLAARARGGDRPHGSPTPKPHGMDTFTDLLPLGNERAVGDSIIDAVLVQLAGDFLALVIPGMEEQEERAERVGRKGDTHEQRIGRRVGWGSGVRLRKWRAADSSWAPAATTCICVYVRALCVCSAEGLATPT